jgi:hypothetical protein
MTDLRGFTTLGESFGDDVEGLTQIMNDYMTALSIPVLKNDGTLIKFIGDASLHVHGAPLDDVNHAKTAVQTALEMIKAIEDGIYDLYRVGELNPFEEVNYKLEEQMRELPEFSDSDEYPLFEIIGGGRIFDKNIKFDKIYNQELFNKIKEIEEFAEGGQAGKKGKLNATYIPKRNIKTLITTYGNTIKGKDLLDGAYTTRKDIRQDPKMVRTIFEEEEFAEFKNGGEAKKRRSRANEQIGKTDRSVDKTRVAKPVGYRFTNSLASKLRKDQYAVPTEKQITKYLGKGIYKENRKNRSDRDRTAKL